jgi:hypothetical protein
METMLVGNKLVIPDAWFNPADYERPDRRYTARLAVWCSAEEPDAPSAFNGRQLAASFRRAALMVL